MPEDPIAHSELSALTRRYEGTAQKTDREFGIVKSDLTALRLQVGNLDQKVDGLGERLDGLEQKIDGFLSEQRSVNATLVELLSGLVAGRPPPADPIVGGASVGSPSMWGLPRPHRHVDFIGPDQTPSGRGRCVCTGQFPVRRCSWRPWTRPRHAERTSSSFLVQRVVEGSGRGRAAMKWAMSVK